MTVQEKKRAEVALSNVGNKYFAKASDRMITAASTPQDYVIGTLFNWFKRVQ